MKMTGCEDAKMRRCEDEKMCSLADLQTNVDRQTDRQTDGQRNFCDS